MNSRSPAVDEHCSRSPAVLVTADRGGWRGADRRSLVPAIVRSSGKYPELALLAGASWRSGDRRRRRKGDRRDAGGAGGLETWFWLAEKQEEEEREQGRVRSTCGCVRCVLPTSAVSETAGGRRLVAADVLGGARRLERLQDAAPVLLD